MAILLKVAAALLVLALAAILAMRFRRKRLAKERHNAMDQFAKQKNALSGALLQTASQSGKPRGLRWLSTELRGEPLYAIDKKNAELVALIETSIRFEAIEGGDMEDVEAVHNVRTATAIFTWQQTEWKPDERILFNLLPKQALEQYANYLMAFKE